MISYCTKHLFKYTFFKTNFVIIHHSKTEKGTSVQLTFGNHIPVARNLTPVILIMIIYVIRMHIIPVMVINIIIMMRVVYKPSILYNMLESMLSLLTGHGLSGLG